MRTKKQIIVQKYIKTKLQKCASYLISNLILISSLQRLLFKITASLVLAVFLAFLLLAVLVIAPIRVAGILVAGFAVHPLLELVFHFVALTPPLTTLRLPAVLGRQCSANKHQSDEQDEDRG